MPTWKTSCARINGIYLGVFLGHDNGVTSWQKPFAKQTEELLVYALCGCRMSTRMIHHHCRTRMVMRMGHHHCRTFNRIRMTILPHMRLMRFLCYISIGMTLRWIRQRAWRMRQLPTSSQQRPTRGVGTLHGQFCGALRTRKRRVWHGNGNGWRQWRRLAAQASRSGVGSGQWHSSVPHLHGV